MVVITFQNYQHLSASDALHMLNHDIGQWSDDIWQSLIQFKLADAQLPDNGWLMQSKSMYARIGGVRHALEQFNMAADEYQRLYVQIHGHKSDNMEKQVAHIVESTTPYLDR